MSRCLFLQLCFNWCNIFNWRLWKWIICNDAKNDNSSPWNQINKKSLRVGFLLNANLTCSASISTRKVSLKVMWWTEQSIKKFDVYSVLHLQGWKKIVPLKYTCKVSFHYTFINNSLFFIDFFSIPLTTHKLFLLTFRLVF